MADYDWSEDDSLANLLLRGWINPEAKSPFMRDEKGNRRRDSKGHLVRYERAKTHPWEYQAHGFFKVDSKEEQEARTALARLLRSGRPLHQQLRNVLADLFEGVERFFPDYPEFNLPSSRRIVFKEQKKERKDFARRTEIATHVWKLQKKYGVESAVHSAMKRYNLGRRHVMEIWHGYKPIFERDPSLAGDP